MREWDGVCQRCYRESNAHTMSMFNTDLICMDCKEAERQHPNYRDAENAEVSAILGGDYNFPGTGLPTHPGGLGGIIAKDGCVALSCTGDAEIKCPECGEDFCNNHIDNHRCI